MYTTSRPSVFEKGEWISSYYVMALFTLVPVDLAISIIRQKVQQDSPTQQDLHDYTAHHHIAGILPKNTHFLFQGKYYEQVHGAAMGSCIIPFVANLFVEEFKSKDINTAPIPPRLWVRYVVDIFVIQKAEHSKQFHTTAYLLTHTYSSPQRFPTAVVPFHFWTLWSPLYLTTHYKPLYMGNLPIQTSISTGTATTTSLWNTLSLALMWHIGTGLSMPMKSYYRRRRNTLEMSYLGDCIPFGP